MQKNIGETHYSSFLLYHVTVHTNTVHEQSHVLLCSPVPYSPSLHIDKARGGGKGDYRREGSKEKSFRCDLVVTCTDGRRRRKKRRKYEDDHAQDKTEGHLTEPHVETQTLQREKKSRVFLPLCEEILKIVAFFTIWHGLILYCFPF